MTSATIKPGTGGRHAERHGYGLVLFASILLVVIGCFSLIYGIAAIANSHVSVANAPTCSPTCAPGAGSPWLSAPCNYWRPGHGGQPAGPLVRRGSDRAQRH